MEWNHAMENPQLGLMCIMKLDTQKSLLYAVSVIRDKNHRCTKLTSLVLLVLETASPGVSSFSFCHADVKYCCLFESSSTPSQSTDRETEERH